MISKELLSAVLGYEVYDISNYHEQRMADYKEDFISFKSYLNGCRKNPINVHELAHKCKEWCVAQPLQYNFHISVVTHKGSEYSATIAYWSDQLKNKSFRASSEPEAVFKACEWILHNKQASND